MHGRVLPASDPPQQQAAHIVGPAQRQDQRQPAARRATADIGGQGIELHQQLVQVFGPLLVFRVAVDRDSGGAAIAPVVDQDPVAGLGDLLGEGPHRCAGAPPARLQRHPRAALAEDLVIDIDAANAGDGHGFLPDEYWRRP
jgi:hypothetical protein